MGRESDLYAALGVPPDASPAEIAGAYRRLVRANHPDMRSDSDQPAATPLDEIVAAYEVLRDPDRRAAYDRRRRRLTSARRSPRAAVAPVRRGPDLRGVGPVHYHPRG